MKKMVILTALCIASLIAGLMLFNTSTKGEDPRGDLYAGAKSCAKCHSNIYDSYLHTAHYLASLPATEKTVHGTFEQGHNEFKVNERQKVIMEKIEKGLFQTYYLNGRSKQKYPFDIVFGGVKGESYLTWNGNELYQLPLSYYSRQHQWSTSPGYGFNFLEYPHLRSIRKRCMECHASYIDDLPRVSNKLSDNEQFDKSSLVYGIDCERCHGPAKKHAEYQTQNPLAKTAKYVTAYSSLNRRQKVDMCAVCHSGNPSVMLRSTFYFVPGDAYNNFKIPDLYPRVDTMHLDVHGNQVQLLESSKCYINSNMDCATCHNTHQNSRGANNLFAEKCLSCHNTAGHSYCKMIDVMRADVLKANCINCHMPTLQSKAISVQTSDKITYVRFSVHTHHIAVYPIEVKKILAYINK